MRIPLLRFLVCGVLTVSAAGIGEDVKIPKTGPSKTLAKSEVPEGVSSADWSSIRAAYEAGRHAAHAVDDGYQAQNPRQQWTTRFDGRGFTTRPDAGGWSWGLELQSFGGPGREKFVSSSRPLVVNGSHVSHPWDEVLTEWYRNDTRGLEHGFTVHSRPAGVDGALSLTLAVRGELHPRVEETGRDVRFVQGSDAPVLTYSGLTVTDAYGKALSAQFESTSNGLRLSVDVKDARYPLTIDPIAQQAYLKASNTEADDFFGSTVAVSGETVVVGAASEDSNATGVNGIQSDNSAESAGAVYVFVRNGTTWSQQAYLKASNSEMSDRFGNSVSISGDTIVVGAPFECSNATGVNGNQSDNSANGAGAAYVFVRTGTTWSQQAYLKGSNSDTRFGWRVAVSGNTVVVGEPFYAQKIGQAYVFVRNGSVWTEQSRLANPSAGFGNADDSFGASVSVSGDTLVIGAPFESSNATGINGNQSDNSAASSGAAYVFARTGTTWFQQAYLKASNTDKYHEFGWSVSISGNTVVVGSISESSNVGGSGAAYVFVRSGTTWSQQAFLKASNPGIGDGMGWSVAVSGDTVVVGAAHESSNATGVNGNQSDTSAETAGAAYVFARTGTTWSQQAYVKASNTGAGDFFGSTVAVSGDTIVVGAPAEDSNVIGVNGNPIDNSASNAGAAYVFDLSFHPGTLSYGTGTPGCAGTQTLDVKHAPMINSPHFAITCNNAPPSSLGLGVVTDSQDLLGSDPFFIGVLQHVDFSAATEVLAFDFVSDATGQALTTGIAIPNSLDLIGKTYYAEALWVWTACSLPPFNFSSSRGLAITIQAP